MIRRCVWVAIWAFVILGGGGIQAQPPRPEKENATPPLGVEKYYFDLSKSEDRSIRATAERYIALVKVQEWSDLSGKFKAVAHYVKHDANLSTVTIAIMKGSGADRAAEEKTVPVDKLSKTCQVRVKQIDLLQKKLKEMSTKAGPNGTPGAPMADERGTDPNAKVPDPGPGASPAAAPDPSASEPDPLGFAEVQLAPPPAPGGPPPGAPGAPAPSTPDAGPGDIGPPGGGRPGAVSSPAAAPPSAPPSNSGANKLWQQDFEAFRQNFKVYPVGPGQPQAPPDRKLVRAWEGSPIQHTAEWDVDFGDLDDLRVMSDSIAMFTSTPRNLLSQPENQKKLKEASEAEKRIGEVNWEATFNRFNGPKQPIDLVFSELPKPLQITSVMDPQASTPELWSALARGDRIRFKGRLSMSNIDDIKVTVREPVKVASSSAQAR
jgi:hypothetical protein